MRRAWGQGQSGELAPAHSASARGWKLPGAPGAPRAARALSDLTALSLRNRLRPGLEPSRGGRGGRAVVHGSKTTRG